MTSFISRSRIITLNVVQSAGNATLTGDLSLKGKRTYGDDHYTGTYVADYKDFSKTESEPYNYVVLP